MMDNARDTRVSELAPEGSRGTPEPLDAGNKLGVASIIVRLLCGLYLSVPFVLFYVRFRAFESAALLALLVPGWWFFLVCNGIPVPLTTGGSPTPSLSGAYFQFFITMWAGVA